MTRLTVASLKGGVGKTSIAVSLAAIFGARGQSVLFCDVDSQANASSLMGYRAGPDDFTIADLLTYPPRASLAQVVIPDALPGVDLLPARLDALTEVADRLVTSPGGDRALARALDGVDDIYDWVIFDTPPTLGRLSLNAVAASNVVLAVVNPVRWAAEGATRVAAFVNEARDVQISDAVFIGGVLNKVPAGKRVVGDLVLDDLRHAGVHLLESVVPLRTAVEQGEYLGSPVVLSDPTSDTADALRLVADEVAVLAGQVAADKAEARRTTERRKGRTP